MGQPRVLQEATALLDAGISCGLFVDNESRHGGQRDQLRQRDNCAFGCWDGVVNIEEAVARWLPVDQLSELADLEAGLRAQGELDSVLQQVGQRAGKPGKESIDSLLGSQGEKVVRDALCQAMQNGSWFKQMDRARALGKFLLEKGIPPEIEKVFLKFWESIKKVRLGTE